MKTNKRRKIVCASTISVCVVEDLNTRPVIGPKDSGKTSWVAPFQGIIPLSRIATITREKQFSTQCISDNTQLVFMDEWTSDSLDVETAKKFLQGGLYVASVKHKRPTTSILKCPFFITTQQMPDFGEVDNSRSLEELVARANDWLRKHCMQVFHFVADALVDELLFR